MPQRVKPPSDEPTEEQNELTRKEFAALADVPDAKPRGVKLPTLTRSEFASLAKPLSLTIDGAQLAANPKEMSTGSLGWHVSAKVQVKVGDRIVEVMANINLPIIGSKNLPKV